jgi:hypothetical protein
MKTGIRWYVDYYRVQYSFYGRSVAELSLVKVLLLLEKLSIETDYDYIDMRMINWYLDRYNKRKKR